MTGPKTNTTATGRVLTDDDLDKSPGCCLFRGASKTKDRPFVRDWSARRIVGTPGEAGGLTLKNNTRLGVRSGNRGVVTAVDIEIEDGSPSDSTIRTQLSGSRSPNSWNQRIIASLLEAHDHDALQARLAGPVRSNDLRAVMHPEVVAVASGLVSDDAACEPVAR